MAVAPLSRLLRLAPGAQMSSVHWPEWLIEGACLGLFMVSICLFGTLFEHPVSPVRQQIENANYRRVPMGIAVGLTAIVLIYSRMGQRSGAHMNPAMTLAYLRLGKIHPGDAAGYIGLQIIGGVAGVQAAALLLLDAVGHPSINYLPTTPGPDGIAVAFVAEALMSAALMLAVLVVSNRPSVAQYTGLCAGLLVAVFIIVEAPLSGMSLNPARSLGSAVAAGVWSDFWVYVVAPPLGMVAAAQGYAWVRGHADVICAKLRHPAGDRCHFKCQRTPQGASPAAQ